MDNKEIIEKIQKWQEAQYIHPLTCDKCSSMLKAIERNDKIILICTNENCDYEQENIPEVMTYTDVENLNPFKHLD